MKSNTLGGMAPGEVLAAREASIKRTVLGQVERRCRGCGHLWDRPDHCAHCGSFEFEEKEIRPAAMVITGAGIETVKEQPKPSLLATSQDIEPLRQLRTVLVEVEAKMSSADLTMRHVVNRNTTNFEVFGRIQEVLNLMATPGDFVIQVGNPLRAIGLLQMTRAVIGEIDAAIAGYEKEAIK
jgi:hypothetical protein